MNWKLYLQQGGLLLLVGAFAATHSNDAAPWWLDWVITAMIIMVTRWMVDTAVEPYRSMVRRSYLAQRTGDDWSANLNPDERRVMEELNRYIHS